MMGRRQDRWKDRRCWRMVCSAWGGGGRWGDRKSMRKRYHPGMSHSDCEGRQAGWKILIWLIPGRYHSLLYLLFLYPPSTAVFLLDTTSCHSSFFCFPPSTMVHTWKIPYSHNIHFPLSTTIHCDSFLEDGISYHLSLLSGKYHAPTSSTLPLHPLPSHYGSFLDDTIPLQHPLFLSFPFTMAHMWKTPYSHTIHPFCLLPIDYG